MYLSMTRQLLSAWLVLVAVGAVRAVDISRRPCVVEGFYDAGAETTQPCPGALPCEPGFYCTGGKKIPCPAGTYGAEAQLRRKQCSGTCPAGYYCPTGTSQPKQCGGTAFWCPLGSASPRRVKEGYYSIGVTASRRDNELPCERGFYCTQGTMYPCPAGTYGASASLSTAACSALCPAGSYCPLASISPIKCPAGRYGVRTGESESSCTGQCREGYYCPEGSISATAYPCGVGVYCPRGSGSPVTTLPGEYVINGGSKVATTSVKCPVGSYCSSTSGAAELCPPGTFGDRPGLTTSACTGPCTAGYYCPRGSTKSTAFVCGGADVFCPQGSATPTRVAPGYYTTGELSLPGRDQDPEDATTRFAQRKCEPGHYCINGVRAACPGGTYGSSYGLTSSQCSGACEQGHYCPERSFVATIHRCGSTDFFCPAGSASPTRVMKGYCSTGGPPTGLTHSAQREATPGEYAFLGVCYPCPAGRYGSANGEIDPRCSDDCLPGYYCPVGSSRPTEKECGGASVFCPAGSPRPLPVDTGYYTSIDTQELCPPGKYRDATTTVSAFLHLATARSPVTVNYGDAAYPLAQCVLCPTGTFKAAPGDAISLCLPCPEYTSTSSSDRRTCECFRRHGGPPFDSAVEKLHFTGTACELKPLAFVEAAALEAQDSVYTRARQFACEPGYYCQGGVRKPCPGGYYGALAKETRPTCTGKCAPGYYCPLASTNSTQLECGDASVYCPEGSTVPTPVTPGYFTIRSAVPTPVSRAKYEALNATVNAHIRDAQQICQLGYYCVMGQQFICPAGRYGDQLGETSPLCAGLCKRGYFCPAGSTSPKQIECGGSGSVCRTGSPGPVAVLQGYYSVGGDPYRNTTRFHQRPCEPGRFCVDGVKYQCPAGTFGATAGLSTPACSGKCNPGYYCPSYPYPPSTSATEIECGDSTVFCTEGTGNSPLPVRNGFFSIGAGDGTGDARNTTRVAEQRCPRGHYCRGGIVIRCPAGTYGDREGLVTTDCSGWCPAGFFCPPGTADYRSNPCPARTFAVAGSAYCMACGGNQSNVPASLLDGHPCTDKRECCFFG